MSEMVSVGVSEVDVTPDYPVRLSGYGARREETAKTKSPLYARALAIGAERPVLLLALDNCGVTASMTESVARELRRQAGIDRERIVLCYTHTHNAPMLSGAAPMLFSTDIPAAHQRHIDRYAEEVMERLVEVGLRALSNRRPSRLSYSEGHAGFAVNRRAQIGPVDHVMPMIRVDDRDGNLRAVWVSYACHCTTFGPADNFMCGDWAGFAADRISQSQPGAVALVTIGCAANANPFPRTGLSLARRHGGDIAWEVDRLLGIPGRPLSDRIRCRLVHASLPYDTIPSREAWMAKAEERGAEGYHARKWIARMDNGEAIPETLSYPVQGWSFGDELAIVFLAGEVVADYAFRLRRIYDTAKLWVGAYANDFPGYIPSRRIWKEGGYEAGDATVYFGLPNRFADEVEERVVEAVQRVIPETFRRPRTNGD
ncbi:MAG: neutral/alkaline non-lysosomal ceramidase N-terminal domain-containing protein [Gemmatimonadetes bacterium]|nr:neutral/alkaline non-lysosomal ceramidase N-terminal domain-containing protein [Gemmatimonadota bacterium]